MRAKALAMLTRSLDALVRMDPKCAREVRAADDEVDALNRKLFQEFAPQSAETRTTSRASCAISRSVGT
jgi:phosphate uptake regulator